MLISINTDTYFIAERLKEIDKNYFLVFNTKSKKYEVHNKGQADNTFCVGLPFMAIDERVIDLVQKTRVENINKLIEEIEKNNEKIEKQNKNTIKIKIQEVLNES